VERAPAPALKWLAYGDSITQGMTASQPVFPWPARTARALNAEVVNYGVGGATLRRELADCMPETNADLITVSYGANDWNTDVPLARFRENAQALVEALRRAFPRTLIVLTTPIPFFRATGPNASGAHLDDFRRVIEETAQGRDGVHAVRGPDLVPADRAYFYDWSHPNDSGMQEIATNLLKKLKPLGLAI
jgi:lysophospholipase L1-like esterase